MKQAVLNNPHFCFLESVFKEVPLPPQTADMNVARAGMTLKEQQILNEQQKTELASAILASAQFQIQMEQQAQQFGQGEVVAPYVMEMHSPIHSPFLGGIPPTNYPVVQELAATVPLSPNTPTTQLVNGMIQMLKCNKKPDATGGGQQRLAGIKRTSTDGGVDEDRPKRGRPKKLKPEKCVDDELYEEASRNIAKVYSS